ncbi:hypothetical protein BGY98DRAFT_545164 [Russula aff. rugulosa BPL654]|nr:hypothetical protein BGY98DRAFT_545164 [Russula aff. rugulosa BPL654]
MSILFPHHHTSTAPDFEPRTSRSFGIPPSPNSSHHRSSHQHSHAGSLTPSPTPSQTYLPSSGLAPTPSLFSL